MKETFKPFVAIENHINALLLTREYILGKTGRAETFGTKDIVTFHGEYAIIEKNGVQQTALPGDYVIRQFNELSFCSSKKFNLLYTNPEKCEVYEKWIKSKEKFVDKNVAYISIHDAYDSFFTYSYTNKKITFNLSTDSDKSFLSVLRYLVNQVEHYDKFYVMWKLFRTMDRKHYTFLFESKKNGKLEMIQKIIKKDRINEIKRIKENGY